MGMKALKHLIFGCQASRFCWKWFLTLYGPYLPCIHKFWTQIPPIKCSSTTYSYFADNTFYSQSNFKPAINHLLLILAKPLLISLSVCLPFFSDDTSCSQQNFKASINYFLLLLVNPWFVRLSFSFTNPLQHPQPCLHLNYITDSKVPLTLYTACTS